MNNKLKFWLIIPVCAIVLLIGGTYAWYVWQTSSDEETIIATDVGYAKVFFDGGSDVTGKLKPVSDKSKGMSKEITVSADKEFIEDITFNLYLDINSIDAGLKHESFKFELYKDGNLVKAGNFSDAYLTSALSECTTNEGVSHITLTSDIVTTTESVYTLYTWIDGNMNNPLSMESQNFDFTLHASGQHAILEEPPTIPEGATYIRGAILGERNKHDMTNAIIYTEGMRYPGEPEVGDIFQAGNYEYVYGHYIETGLSLSSSNISYAENSVTSPYVLSMDYKSDEETQYYNNAEFIRTGAGKGTWTRAEGKYDDADGWGVAYFLGSTHEEEIFTTINGKNVINFTGAFYAILGAPGFVNIPETVKYMDYAFYNFRSTNYNNLKIKINSEQIISAVGMYDGNNSKYFEIPANSTTYDTIMSANLEGSDQIKTFVKE